MEEWDYYMNYQNIYNNIIQNAQQRLELTERFEKHHIIPRSMGGSNDKQNLVKLTLREHFICHLLLAKIYGGGMLHAAMMLSSFTHYNSRMYAWLKEKYVKERMIGDNNPSRRFPASAEKRRKSSEGSKERKWFNNGIDSCMAKGSKVDELLAKGWTTGRLKTESLLNGVRKGGKMNGGWNKGIPLSEERKKHLSSLHKGKPSPTKGKKLTPEQREKRKGQNLGSKRTNEIKQKMSENMKGIHLGKRYINKDGKRKRIKPEEIQSYLDQGWNLGKK